MSNVVTFPKPNRKSKRILVEHVIHYLTKAIGGEKDDVAIFENDHVRLSIVSTDLVYDDVVDHLKLNNVVADPMAMLLMFHHLAIDVERPMSHVRIGSITTILISTLPIGWLMEQTYVMTFFKGDARHPMSLGVLFKSVDDTIVRYNLDIIPHT